MILTLKEWGSNGIKLSDSDGQIDVTARADEGEKVVYDLRVGDVFWSPGPDTGQKLNPGDRLRIAPGDMRRIRTREKLDVGNSVFGLVVSRASWTFRGLVVANIKVDPLFKGVLQVSLYNTSDKAVIISGDDTFCSIFFQKLSSQVEGEHRNSPDVPPRDYSKIKGLWFDNKKQILTVGTSLLLSILGSLIATGVWR